MDERLRTLLEEAADTPPIPPVDVTAIQAVARRRRMRRAAVGTAGAAVVLVLTVGLLSSRAPDVESPGESSAPMTLALLDRPPTGEDNDLEAVVGGGGVDGLIAHDAGSARIATRVGAWRYGIATTDGGLHICVAKLGQGNGIGVASCVSSDDFEKNGVLALATNSVPDHLGAHVHLALVVADRYTHVGFDGRTIAVQNNMVVIDSPPFPSAINLIGLDGTRRVAMPQIPEPGGLPTLGTG
jgi:hypothetical protein